jgi:hypothetical protein
VCYGISLSRRVMHLACILEAEVRPELRLDRRVVKGIRDRVVEALVTDAPAVLARHSDPDELCVRDVDLKGFVLKLRRSGQHTYALIYGRGKTLTLGGSLRTSLLLNFAGLSGPLTSSTGGRTVSSWSVFDGRNCFPTVVRLSIAARACASSRAR